MVNLTLATTEKAVEKKTQMHLNSVASNKLVTTDYTVSPGFWENKLK